MESIANISNTQQEKRLNRMNLKNQLLIALQNGGIRVSRVKKNEEIFPNNISQNFQDRAIKTKSRALSISTDQLQADRSLLRGFEVKQKIGFGSQSTIHRCVERSTLKSYALKIIKNSGQQIMQDVRQGFQLVQRLDHKNIIKMKQLIIHEATQKCQLVSELYDFKDLRAYIEEQKALNQQFSQENACEIIRQILSALLYLKESRVCHRDIKPENILYNPQTGELKIIDFEIARAAKNQDEPLDLWTDTGSIYYRAPESLQGGYDERVDMWALGVIAYELMAGKLPFFSTSKSVMRKKISTQKIDFTGFQASIEYQVFLKAILEKNPQNRLTPEQALDLNIFSVNNVLKKSISDAETEPGTPNDVLHYNKITMQTVDHVFYDSQIYC